MAAREDLVDPRDTPFQREQDAWQRELEKAVALAIGQSLIDRGLLSRRCNDLVLNDLIGIGVDACGEYARMREERQVAEGKMPTWMPA